MSKIVAPVKSASEGFATENENPKQLDYHRAPKLQASSNCKHVEHVAFGANKTFQVLHLDLTTWGFP